MMYFDNAATTKPSLNALKFAEKFNSESYFNASALYKQGLGVSKEIKASKDVILKSLGARNHEVVFTSCGSESNNTVIFGAVKHGVLITDIGEHASVYKTFLQRKNNGETVEFVGLNSYGGVDTEKLFEYVKANKVDFISIMHVNNETGAINDVNYIANKVKQINPNILFHVDGVQAFGKIPYIISDSIDYYTVSAHKVNGLKGVGAVIKRKNAKLSPLICGGGQENGFRSGTENVFGIKVFEFVTAEHYKNITENYNCVKALNNYVIDNLDKSLFKIISSENGSPFILSVSAVGLRGEVIMHCLEERNILVGNGSACSSKNRFSRVIEACGYGKEVLDGVIRISFSSESAIDETKSLVSSLNEIAYKLKGIMKK